MADGARLLITCEHGGNRIPAHYRYLFAGHESELQTHRGWDAGALAMAEDLARTLHARLFFATVSRLLIDLNRGVGHPGLYSAWTRNAPADVRREILEDCYLPYRSRAAAYAAAEIAGGRRVIHISSHSFTPTLDGEVRNADIGLLYDPGRAAERELCRRWQAALETRAPGFKVRRNYPYSGKSDGFTAYLRRRLPANRYAGIELEINQKRVLPQSRRWRDVRLKLLAALGEALREA